MKKIALALATVAFAAVATPAIAGDLVKVPAHSTLAYRISAAGDFFVHAEGFKSDADVDYRLISPVGRTLHEDTDSTAWTEAFIDADSSGTFTLYIQNVSDEDTVVEVSSRSVR
ncbi:hypothetical protein Q9Q95_13470 [Sphingomonas sp. DG1-23]|uniref:hypothetical protein n=1 Tax=Sphingomonas sp. DG1-23 TaxID=3068316 RepID=UPI00273EE5B5|nr:hypothetical protein [Sphingomonas sp. DG1-23]MDP5279939.1 hypothetical protein [Sphingomonas sp. DG1-23]